MERLGILPVTAFEDWKVGELQRMYPRLRLTPVSKICLEMLGPVEFCVQKPGSRVVSDCFFLRVIVPFDFPSSQPQIFPLEDRIPMNFHRFDDGSLCLGNPTRIQLSLVARPNLLDFFNEFVIPYLYSFVLFEAGDPMPFGELRHGSKGLIDDYMSLFSVSCDRAAVEMLSLTSKPRRKANRHFCPCGSNLRLSKCSKHHKIVIYLRKSLGRLWFKRQLALIETN